MEIKIIISEHPKYKTCNKIIYEWNPFIDEHEHVECISECISSNLIDIIKKQIQNKKL